MRHAEPKMITLYKEWVNAGPPRCCHTCEMYGTDGLCTEFFMEPPAEFAEAVGECSKWMQEIPF
jgi:hypothetical protein